MPDSEDVRRLKEAICALWHIPLRRPAYSATFARESVPMPAPVPMRQEEAMSEDAVPSASATLAFPDTRLTSERLWVSSALSVLRQRQRPYLHPLFYEAYEEAIVAMEALEAFLRDKEEPDADWA